MATTIKKLIYASMRKIGVLGSGKEPTLVQIADVRNELIAMLDTWRLESLMVVASATLQFDLVPTKSQYTYSEVSGSDFLSPRPIEVRRAVIIDAAGTRFPLQEMSIKDYASEQSRGVLGTPDRFVYIAAYPQATLGFNCIPLEPKVELVVQGQIATVPTSVDEAIDFAPGYYDAIMYNLAIRICPDFEVSPDQVTVAMAASSKDLIKRTNLTVSKITPRHPHSGRSRFNINDYP